MNILSKLLCRTKTEHSEPTVLRFYIERLDGRKSCSIEIRTDQSFTDLDLAIRNSLGYDTWDHCSAFFTGVPWISPSIVEIYPDNSAQGQLQPISSFSFAHNTALGYVYDFGEDIQHYILVEQLLHIDESKLYPCVISKTTSRTNKRKKLSRTRDS